MATHAQPANFQQTVQAATIKRASNDRRIILANGSSVQVFRVAPWLGAILLGVVFLTALGVIGAASYLFFRDELFTASIKRQHQIQVAYEDRIAELRREIDRISSRQLLNQQSYEARVERLLTDHASLYLQGQQLGPVLDRAGNLGLMPRQVPPPPVIPPNVTTGTMTDELRLADPIITGSIPTLPVGERERALMEATTRPAEMLDGIEAALGATQHNQIAALAGLSAMASLEADQITDHLEGLGISVELTARNEVDGGTATSGELGVGGPLLPAVGASRFERYLAQAEASLADLQGARAAVATVPVAAPTRGARLSSRFGNRRDPFTGRTAFHAGIDYAAPTGHPVYAPADGVVTRASRRGGYGLMVEIDHEHGLFTRFAHLSRMLVAPGERVEAGDVIGRIGSTGRSTGPHLHYEIRRGSRAIDPMPFVRAGQRLDEFR